MKKEVTFFVPGTPIPQGSKTAYVRGGRAVLVEANKNHKAWRDKVAEYAAPYAGAFGKHVPVRACYTYVFRKPKSVKDRPHHVVKPDVDKLDRCLNDALTKAGVIHDDAQIIGHFGEDGKKYIPHNSPDSEGAIIELRQA